MNAEDMLHASSKHNKNAYRSVTFGLLVNAIMPLFRLSYMYNGTMRHYMYQQASSAVILVVVTIDDVPMYDGGETGSDIFESALAGTTARHSSHRHVAIHVLVFRLTSVTLLVCTLLGNTKGRITLYNR